MRPVRSILVVVAVLAASACSGSSRTGDTSAAKPGPGPDETTELHAVADAYLEWWIEAHPESTYFASVPETVHDRLADRSLEAIATGRAHEDALLERLRAVEPAHLRPPDRVLHASLLEKLEASVARRVCREELWSVDHMWGWQAMFPLVLEKQPVGTPAARSDALARWSQLPAYVEAEIRNLRAGLDRGYSSPQSVVRLVIGQLDGLLGERPEDSPFGELAKRDGTPDFRRRWLALVHDEILPAIRAYRSYLTDEYLPRARTSLAITSHPDGDECYRAALRDYTSLEVAPRTIHDRGAALVRSNERDIAGLGRELYGTGDITEVIERVKDDPAYRLSEPDAVLAFARSTADRARAALPRLFHDIPDVPGVVKPWPASVDGPGMSDIYSSPSGEGDEGVYRITLRERRNAANLEVTTVHELYPGHHVQTIVEQSLPDRHPVMATLGNSAYAEGWGRYAERLAEEAGILRLEGSRITRRAWPGRGMVVDPGIHALGWSRERAIEYMRASGRFTDEFVEKLPDRIAVMPGQLTAYDTGALEIVALRTEAERTLGEDFDLREFHERVLEYGEIPLWLLRQRIEGWIDRETR